MRSASLFFALMMSITACARGGETLRYLALGDSYSIGEGVAEPERWPNQLARRLRADGIALGDPRIIATTGWTTDELSAAMDAVEPLGEWDFVSLLIGVNNQYRGRSVENFRSEFASLLERSIRLARGRHDRVLVLAIPDWGVTPFGRASDRDLADVSRQLDAYNAVLREESLRRGVDFVDIATLSRARGAEPAMVTQDGLHPSAAVYAEWTALALPMARKRLASEN